MIKSFRVIGFTVALIAATGYAQATTIVLDFENINATYPSTNYAFVQNFYDGGTSDQATSGTNFGIGFSSNAQAICLNTLGNNSCSNTSRGGLGNPSSDKGGLFFLSGTQTFMNIAAGFTTGFSFFYTAINNPASVSVFSGLGGTGSLLATLNLALTTSNCSSTFGALFCPFQATGIAFAGTAQSVAFAGAADQVAFDDVTFGSRTPGGGGQQIPEPGSLLLFAMGLLGLATIRRRRYRL